MRRLLVVGVDVLSAESFHQQIREAAQREEECDDVSRAPQSSALTESLSPARIPERVCRRAWRIGESHRSERDSPRRGFVPTSQFIPGHRQQ